MAQTRLASVSAILAFLAWSSSLVAQPAARVDGLKSPRSAVVGADGKTYLTVAGAAGQNGGAVLRIDNGKTAPFASGFAEPSGIAGGPPARTPHPAATR